VGDYFCLVANLVRFFMKETKVSWLEWDKEAFKKAQELDKPILLGISAVWCTGVT
jgi:uncharacterized protein YyaL (SSP411 family)